MIAHKTDSNQAAIVETLRECGAFVWVTSDQGRGFPDLVVCWHGRWLLLEVKDKRGKSTPQQIIFNRECGGHVLIVRSRLEAIEALNRDVRNYTTVF